MRPIEAKMLQAAVDEHRTRTALEIFCNASRPGLDRPQFAALDQQWRGARDALRETQAEFVREINALKVPAPVVLP